MAWRLLLAAGLAAVAALWFGGRSWRLGYEQARVEAWAEVQALIALGRLQWASSEEAEAGDYGPIPARAQPVEWKH